MRRIVLAFLLALPLTAQNAEINSITVSVSRPVSLPATELVYTMTLRAVRGSWDPASMLAALTAAGVTNASLSDVQADTTVTLTLQTTVPAAQAQAEEELLAKAKRQLSSVRNTLDLTWWSSDATPPESAVNAATLRAYPALLTDARAKAAIAAAAAGLTLGSVLSVSELTTTYQIFDIPTSRGAFFFGGLYSAPRAGTLTVKFAASRY